MNEVWIVIRRDSDGETLIKGVYANRELIEHDVKGN